LPERLAPNPLLAAWPDESVRPDENREPVPRAPKDPLGLNPAAAVLRVPNPPLRDERALVTPDAAPDPNERLDAPGPVLERKPLRADDPAAAPPADEPARADEKPLADPPSGAAGALRRMLENPWPELALAPDALSRVPM
jgi:hypothetical protein